MSSNDDILRLLEPLQGIDLPSDPVAVAAATLNASASTPFLANHAFRSFAWAAWFGRRDGIDVDGRQLWVASVLHDIGLTGAAQGDDCMAATYMNELGLPDRVAAAPFAE
jgi:HD-GYP domain-containing protein (c-di-GMP phosphodiesterase class II)